MRILTVGFDLMAHYTPTQQVSPLAVTADRGPAPESRPHTASTVLRAGWHLHQLAAVFGEVVGGEVDAGQQTGLNPQVQAAADEHRAQREGVGDGAEEADGVGDGGLVQQLGEAAPVEESWRLEVAGSS
jgi:hypothetical protein